MRNNVNFSGHLTRSPSGDGGKTAAILNAPLYPALLSYESFYSIFARIDSIKRLTILKHLPWLK